jgi:hypothetical protein
VGRFLPAFEPIAESLEAIQAQVDWLSVSLDRFAGLRSHDGSALEDHIATSVAENFAFDHAAPSSTRSHRFGVAGQDSCASHIFRA